MQFIAAKRGKNRLLSFPARREGRVAAPVPRCVALRAGRLVPLISAPLEFEKMNISGDIPMDPDSDPNSGEFIVNHLKQCGSNLSREHEVYFYLYFPSEDFARQAAARVKSQGFEAYVSRSATDTQWLCLVSCPQVPDKNRLDAAANQMECLATEYMGKYDGWEASLELDEEGNSN